MVYVREAHAFDEWRMGQNEVVGVSVMQPTTLRERRVAAQQLCSTMSVTMPMVVDDLDDSVSTDYGAWPERLYVIDADGRVEYQGGYGPFDFKPRELAAYLSERYGPPATP